MKKQIGILAIAVLTALILSACGNPASSAGSPVTTAEAQPEISKSPEELELEAATDAFQAASTKYDQMLRNLDNSVSGANTLLANTSEAKVMDASVLSDLDLAVSNALTFSFEKPEMGSSADEINQQISVLQDAYNTISGLTREVDNAVNRVNQSIEERRKPQFQTVTWQAKNTNGYVYEATLKISPWILQSKTDLITPYWNEISNGKALPTLDDWNFERYSDGAGGKIYKWGNSGPQGTFYSYMTDMYYAVGTVSFKNITEGWHFSEDNPGSIEYGIKFSSESGWDLAFISMVQYSNENRKSALGLMLSSYMTSDNWGPVPFVVAYAESITPNYPLGMNKESVENSYFIIYDNQEKIEYAMSVLDD